MPEWAIIVAALAGCGTFLGFLGTAAMLLVKIGRYMQRLDDFSGKQIEINEARSRQIDAVNAELKKLNDILATMAVQNRRLDTLEKWYDELRRGEGFVFPLSAHLNQGS